MSGQKKIVGMSGTGKTTYMLDEILRLADREDCGLAILLPHAEHGEKLLTYLDQLGHLWRVVLDDLRDRLRVLPKAYLLCAQDKNAFVRAGANEEYRDACLSIPTRRRKDLVDLNERSMIHKFAHVATAVYQNLDEWLPLTRASQFLVKGHALQGWAIRHCTEEQAREDLIRAAELNTHDQMAYVLPAERFLAGWLGRAHVAARTSVYPNFYLPDHLKDCGDGVPGIYIALGGGSREAIQDNMASDFMQIVFDAKAEPSDTPRYVFVDEGVNYGLIHTFEAEALNTLRAFNVFTRWAVQSYQFATPAVETAFRQNTASVIFRQGSRYMAEECAGDLMTLCDEYKVHHHDFTTRQIRKDRKEERRNRSTRRDKHGEVEGFSDTNQTVNLSEFEEREEARASYQQGNEQLFWLARELRRLPVGTCWIQDGDGEPYLYRVPWLPELCVYPEDREEYREEVARCLDEVKRGPLYVEPRALVLPEDACQPVAAPPGGNRKKPGPKNNGRKKPRANPQGNRGR